MPRPWMEKMFLLNQNHTSSYYLQFETKIYAITQADWDLWGFENGWFLTISENVQISDIPYFAHFDTFLFFSHNFQANQSILSLKISKGDKILEQLYAERKFEKKITY